MIKDIDLRELSELSSPDKAFLSIYVSEPESLDKMMKKLDRMEKVIENSDEVKHLQENKKMIREYFESNPGPKQNTCIFCCWLLDYLETYTMEHSLGDIIRVDSSPYIKPIAEFLDEYENFAVVVADNKKAKIYLVSAGVEEDASQVAGNVKNHVKVGGWSQQRYERRRDKQLKRYAREIVEKLNDLNKREKFRRIILVGSAETVNEIKNELPQHLEKQLVGEKDVDVKKDDDYINQEIFQLFFREERESEKDLWEKIKDSYFKNELGVLGVEDVLKAAEQGRVEIALVDRDKKLSGVRCRDCEKLSPGKLEECPVCGSASVFEVDLANELVELLTKTGAEVDFTEGIDELKKAGSVAALLRY